MLAAAVLRSVAQNPSPPLPNLQDQLPALSPAPTERSVPPGPTPGNGPAAQARPADVSPLAAQPAAQPSLTDAPSSQVQHTADDRQLPDREDAHGLRPDFLGFLGPFRRPSVPQMFAGNETRLASLIRDGKLYLTLEDAIALALENNLDVEAERYNLVLGHIDTVRAAGGGATRGIDYTVTLPPAGVGGPGSPLLNALTTNTNPTTPAVTDLTALNSTTQQQQSLSTLSTGFQYAVGPNVPLFDPQLIGEAGYLRRSDTHALISQSGAATTTTGNGGIGSTIASGPFDFIELNLAYVQGFSTGAQLTALANDASQVIYGQRSRLDPFYAPSTSVTLTQPLLRGRGSNVSLRYIRIARINQKESRLLFEQQVLESVYGTSRLYYDLVSLGENVLVKQEALRAATKLREDDAEQVKLGTLAPIDLTQAQALESSSHFDLIQAQGLYKQEEIILRHEILRTASPVFTAQFSEIVPTDRITVPDTIESFDVPALVSEAVARRPDLAQAKLQVETGKISANASRNNALAQVNLYANVETRGSTEQPYDTLGSIGTGLPTNPQSLATGGLDVSTIYQAGVQVTLPLRNRVAEADAARDTVQLRQVQVRGEKLAAQVREEVETAVVSLQTAEAAYRAASSSRGFQGQLLDAERDKLSVGQSTDLNVLQNEAYLAQALSTEIAARSNYMKARLALDHAMGDLLEKNHVELDDAVRGKLP
jgi:outer membrane protein